LKKLSIMFLFIFVLQIKFSIFAYEFTDWINVGGNNCIVSQKGNTVVFEGIGYYPNANVGVIYADQVDVNNTSIEFYIDKICGKEDSGYDSWISLGIFTKKAYMDISNPAKTAGIVLLIRPNKSGGARVNYYSLLEGQAFGSKKGDGIINKFDQGNTYKLEFKSDAKSGYALYVNNEKITYQGNLADLNYLKGIYTDNKGYIALSMSDNKDTNMKLTITKLGGKTAIGGETVPETKFSVDSEVGSISEDKPNSKNSSQTSSLINSQIETTSKSTEYSTAPSSQIEQNTQLSKSSKYETSQVNEENKSKSNPSGIITFIVIVAVIASGTVYYFLIRPRLSGKKK
jgi:hypothetical protein